MSTQQATGPGGAEALPVQCDPTVFTMDERKAHAEIAWDVVTQWPARREQLENGYLFHYRGDRDLFLKVAEWAADEHRCCGWATYALELPAAAHGAARDFQLRITTADANKARMMADYQLALDQPEQVRRAFMEAKAPITGAVVEQQVKGGACDC